MLGYNLYAYCSNNPVINIDPSGHSIASFFKSAVNSYTNKFKNIWNTITHPVATIKQVLNPKTALKNQVTSIVNLVLFGSNPYAASTVMFLSSLFKGEHEKSGALFGDWAADATIVLATYGAGKIIDKAVKNGTLFSANDGSGFKIGKDIDILYENPHAKGGPGGTFFNINGTKPNGSYGSKFRIDWDPAHGYHSHPPGHGK